FSFDGDEAGRRAARKALDGALPYATDVRTVKFLFLPPEHDPDSYIREHGQDAFARFVRQAVPLSAFLIEAVAEGCDLATAEGRSHMVSNAGPLWKQLPDGALKRQLLGELADRSQLGQHELLEVWGIAPPQRPAGAKPGRRPEGAHGRRDRGRPEYSSRPYGTGRRHTVKPKVIALAELVARAVLRNSQSWAVLSDADHHLLCELEPPLGDLFSWIDTRFHDHGGEPWAVLQLGLEGQPFADLAVRLIDLDEMQPTGKPLDIEEIAEQDVRRAMCGIHLDAVADEIARVAQLPQSDPSRMERLYELTRRQQALLRESRASTT
ncbi:MAG TPA: DNA primase, partial [Telluria sp.]|nr:DNA primase [Telluria sp.]